MLWLTVVMYLRFSQRTNVDGTVVRYVALAHNRRVDGKIKPDVLMNLGRVDRLDVDGLLRLGAAAPAAQPLRRRRRVDRQRRGGPCGRGGADGGRRRPADRRGVAAAWAVGPVGDRSGEN